MGLIADLVESVKAALGGVAGGWRIESQFAGPDLVALKESVTAVLAGEDFATKLGGVGTLLADALLFDEYSLEARNDPGAFLAESFAKWSRLLNEALAHLNVDSPEGFASLDLGDPGSAASALGTQADAAGRRVAAAVSAINLIVLSANGISVAAELATLGTVRSVADAVQSWVWANGLGGLSGMAYQPQLNASVFPWLNRLYQYKAQAGIPGEGDLVRFQLREVFEPQRRAELLEGPERPTFDHYMRERGLSKYWSDSFWAAHWVLPSISQLNEMLFRGVIDRPEWERFVRFNDFDPLSIPRLGEIIYNPYTRVDVRRMADLGVLNEQEQLQAYGDLGFYADSAPDSTGRNRAVFSANPDFTVDKAQALVVFTRLFNALPDLRARYRNGWINEAELLAELTATGIPAERARLQFETIVKVEREKRVAPERELTRGLVARAWKLRLVSFPQAVFLLERLGWEAPEAELILRVQSLPDDPLAFVPTALGFRLGALDITATAESLEAEVT